MGPEKGALARLSSEWGEIVQTRIKNLLAEKPVGSPVQVAGWIRTRRDTGGFSFLEINDGSCLANIQVIAEGGLANYETEVRKLSAGYKPDAVYPYGGLGPSLKLIAQMIHANFGTRLFYCQIGGFDTHANQVAGHESLLGHVATSLAAFMKDLGAKGLDSKVTAMCFSEFGRRVNQNDSNGTDHGAAAPMFVLGGKVKAGLYGTYPSLTQLDDGDLKYTVDFRQIYATILDKWLNADAEKVLNGKFTGLPLYG